MGAAVWGSAFGEKSKGERGEKERRSSVEKKLASAVLGNKGGPSKGCGYVPDCGGEQKKDWQGRVGAGDWERAGWDSGQREDPGSKTHEPVLEAKKRGGISITVVQACGGGTKREVQRGERWIIFRAPHRREDIGRRKKRGKRGADSP